MELLQCATNVELPESIIKCQEMKTISPERSHKAFYDVGLIFRQVLCTNAELPRVNDICSLQKELRNGVIQNMILVMFFASSSKDLDVITWMSSSTRYKVAQYLQEDGSVLVPL
ncbi:hypothetical protein HRG_014411 [Hirsutella rhossiliensis]